MQDLITTHVLQNSIVLVCIKKKYCLSSKPLTNNIFCKATLSTGLFFLILIIMLDIDSEVYSRSFDII